MQMRFAADQDDLLVHNGVEIQIITEDKLSVVFRSIAEGAGRAPVLAAFFGPRGRSPALALIGRREGWKTGQLVPYQGDPLNLDVIAAVFD
jgi:hypothetical protein